MSDTADSQSRGRMIAQFMWGYQHYFRIAVYTRIESALEAIGFWGNPQVVLIGFQVAGEHNFAICIEPEGGPFSPEDLEGVAARAKEFYDQHPDRRMRYSDPRAQQERHDALCDEMRAEAIAEALAATAAGQERTFLVGQSTRVDDYDVHVVVGVDSDPLAGVPQLHTTMRDRMTITPSLVHAVIREVLSQAKRAMYLPEARGELDGETSEIVRTAAAELVRSCLICADHWFGNTTSNLFSAVSTLPYEGRAGSGRVVLARAEHPAIDIVLKFRDPVKIEDTRAVRKLIEASGDAGNLLSNGEQVYGLGSVNETYDPASETVFMVTVTERGTWELSHAGMLLLTIRDGVPRLPERPLNVGYFKDVLDRLLPGADREILKGLAEAAGRNEHGAMLIISSDAAGEAARLAPQAWGVEPSQLSPELLSQLTSMDGGVLVDLRGYCYAVGVILDGMACGDENPARGSRFNNAVRYLASGPPPAIVVVYSTDGNIDILPRLRPRMRRSTVKAAVETYLTLAKPGQPPYGLSDAWKVVKEVRFYLSPDQCEQVNTARAALDRWNEEHNHIRIIEQDLVPNTEMNDSYWLAEERWRRRR